MNKTTFTTNIPSMHIDTFLNTMIPLYQSFLKTDRKLPAIMLWGAPGVGKSDAIKQIAKELAATTKREPHVTDVRLLLYNPVDLRGIPTADENKEFAKWLKPHIFQMDAAENVINFLVLDEITAAPQSVQAAAYQIVLDRQIGEHKLPDNCIIIAAGNRITDKSVAYSMPKALCNRLTHINIEPDAEAWKKWALNKGIDARVVGFLNFKPSTLFSFDPSSQDQAYPTPRSWEMVDNYLKINDNMTVMRPLIEGTIGVGATAEFVAFCNTYGELPDIKDIANGTYKKYPTAPDVNFALQAAIVDYFINNKITEKQLKNLIAYSEGMQAEFAILTARDLICVKDFRKRVVDIPEWESFVEKYIDFVS